MTTVDIIFRSHSGPDVHPGNRILPVPKRELIRGCLGSLIRSANLVPREQFGLRLSILDDHSDPETVEMMRGLAAGASFPVRFVPLETRGVGGSFASAYRYAREQDGDLVYFIEDDYLHAPEALPEMLAAQDLFSRNLGGQEVAIFPVDYPDRYKPEWLRPSYVVLGPRRHWRTIDSTTGTFLISHRAFIANFDHCMKMGQYGIDPTVGEDNSLNRIWRERGVQLFAPVPTLAIHMQGAGEMPPYTDWRRWWEEYGR